VEKGSYFKQISNFVKNFKGTSKSFMLTITRFIQKVGLCLLFKIVVYFTKEMYVFKCIWKAIWTI